MAPPSILLFDIDGTLLSCGGAGRVAFRRALLAELGRDDVCDFPFAGRTDRWIAREALKRARREDTEAGIDLLLSAYLRELALSLEELKERVFAMPAAREVVERALGTEGTAVGLGTGNIEPGGHLKLAAAGLGGLFSFGGFGSDAEDRAELLRVGAERGASYLGLPRERCRVVVIGDTVRDVEAAHAIGAECLAVATGGGSAEELAAAGASAVFPDMSTGAFREALLG